MITFEKVFKRQIFCYFLIVLSVTRMHAADPVAAPLQPALPNVDRVVVSLDDQAFAAYSGGKKALIGPICSGMSGFTSPVGSYRVTHKHAHWISTIYNIPMPFFLRLNGGSVGLHAGFLPGYPASHGCVRLRSEDAQKLFQMTPICTPVSIVKESTPDTYGVPQPPPNYRYYRMVNGKRVYLTDGEVKDKQDTNQKATPYSQKGMR